MGETGVIFTAGIGVMLLLSGRRRKLQLGETRANHSQSDVNVEPADEIEAVTAHTPDSEGESV
jgi:hypothetical protein